MTDRQTPKWLWPLLWACVLAGSVATILYLQQAMRGTVHEVRLTWESETRATAEQTVALPHGRQWVKLTLPVDEETCDASGRPRMAQLGQWSLRGRLSLEPNPLLFLWRLDSSGMYWQSSAVTKPVVGDATYVHQECTCMRDDESHMLRCHLPLLPSVDQRQPSVDVTARLTAETTAPAGVPKMIITSGDEGARIAIQQWLAGAVAILAALGLLTCALAWIGGDRRA